MGDVTITNAPVCMCDQVHRDDGKGVDLEVLPRLSYTRRYISLAVESVRDWGIL